MHTRDASESEQDAVKETLDQIGRSIASARGGLRLTQKELARAAGTSPVTISGLEKGRERVRIDTLTRIAGAVGLTIRLDPAA